MTSRAVFGELVDEHFEEMEQWIGSVAVVTGASAGIGAAIVEKLVKAGVIVVGLARRLNKLEELAKRLSHEKGTFHPKQCDIIDEEEVLKIFRWIEGTLAPVSILINNAGVLKPTTLIDGETELWRNSFDTNVLSICVCTREAVQQMKKHEIDGHIIYISSMSAHFLPKVTTTSTSLHNVYPATKITVNSLMETLRKELIRVKSKIKVSCVSPGMTDTEIFDQYPPEIIENMASIPKLKAEDIAKAVIYILGTPPGVQVQDLLIKTVGEGD